VLLLASSLPFPTKLVGEYIDEERPERIAVTFYGLTLLALVLALTVFVRYAFEHRRLVEDHVDEEAVEGALRYGPSAFYTVAIVVGFLVPLAGVALYLGLALSLGVPARTLRRLLRRTRR
jgi:hypothetical protein